MDLRKVKVYSLKVEYLNSSTWIDSMEIKASYFILLANAECPINEQLKP